MTTLPAGVPRADLRRVDGPVALVTSTMEGGGAQRVVAALASGLAARGQEVDLVLGRATGPFLATIDPRVHVVDLAARRFAAALPPLVRYLRRRRPALVFSALDYVNVVTLTASRLANTGVPVVVSEHNTLSQAVAHTNKLRTRWMPRLLELAYPLADEVVAVSRGVAGDLETLSRLRPGSVRVLNNPVIPPGFHEALAGPVEHPWLSGDGGPPVVIAVGRLMRQKDYPNLLEAFAMVRAERPARLVVLGEGPLRPQLEELVDQLGLHADVSLPGFCANPFPAMAAADVYVLPSAWEGSPTVLVEALACGTPVVATDCPSGPREILEGGRYGALVPVQSPRALADALSLALDGHVARPPRESWLPFTQEVVVTRYLELFQSVARR